MAGDGGRKVQVTADDVGPIIAIITWFFMIMMILAVMFRVLMKLFVRRDLNLGDYTVCGALVFGVSQSIIISVSVQDGLGKRKASLNAEQLISIEQTLYAADLVFIAACSLSKISLLLLLQQLAVSKVHLATVKVSMYIVVAWMISSLCALAFQCGLPHPWATQHRHCLNQLVFWAAIGSIDVITEIVVMTLPMFMMRPVQMAFSKKLVVIFCFLFRICVIVVIVVRIFLLQSYQTSSDFVFDRKASIIATQILASTAITTACIPSLKPFFDSFETGALSVGAQRSGGDFAMNSYEMESNLRESGLRRRVGEAGGGLHSNGTGYLGAIAGHGSRRQKSGSFGSGKSIIQRTSELDVHYPRDQAIGSLASSTGDNEN